jgi:hypothetical protein
MSHARYLGDGVYAHFDGYSIIITTGHHAPRQAEKTVCLEPDVLDALKAYELALRESLAKGETREQL